MSLEVLIKKRRKSVRLMWLITAGRAVPAIMCCQSVTMTVPSELGLLIRTPGH